eukprot:TRINITY_DN40198_c0_g1_i1.p1 TRINITY_DN40198_c0_g1~~TRINITY_DN40198_c0_g1_i1.p1  ORF type:complete len:299 (-),score=39.69 TRINITY_DN40198_c0_g1_i1:146-1015(-)
MADSKSNKDPQKQEKPEIVAKLKLMINRRTKKVAYAEAEKDMVDALISFLILPAGAIAKHSLSQAASASASASASCIENLYRSVQKMPETLMKSSKAGMLHPKPVFAAYSNKAVGIAPPQPPPAEPPKKYYTCNYTYSSSYTHSLTTAYNRGVCACGNSLTKELKLLDKPDNWSAPPATGFVRKKTIFVITDDLQVFPLASSAAMVELWRDLGIRDPSDLEERIVPVTEREVIGLLKASLNSSTALNDVFKETKQPVDLDLDRAALQEILIRLFGDALLKAPKSTSLKA